MRKPFGADLTTFRVYKNRSTTVGQSGPYQLGCQIVSLSVVLSVAYILHAISFSKRICGMEVHKAFGVFKDLTKP